MAPGIGHLTDQTREHRWRAELVAPTQLLCPTGLAQSQRATSVLAHRGPSDWASSVRFWNSVNSAWPPTSRTSGELAEVGLLLVLVGIAPVLRFKSLVEQQRCIASELLDSGEAVIGSVG